MIGPKDIGAAIKRIREAAGMSARELADRTSITESMLDQIESGRVPLTEAQLEKLQQYPVFRDLLADETGSNGSGGHGTGGRGPCKGNGRKS